MPGRGDLTEQSSGLLAALIPHPLQVLQRPPGYKAKSSVLAAQAPQGFLPGSSAVGSQAKPYHASEFGELRRLKLATSNSSSTGHHPALAH